MEDRQTQPASFFEGKSIPNVPVSSPSEQTREKLGAEVCNAFVVSHVRNKLRCVAISFFLQ